VKIGPMMLNHENCALPVWEAEEDHIRKFILLRLAKNPKLYLV